MIMTIDPTQLLTANGLTVAGILAVAVVVLWRMNGSHTRKSQEEAEASQEKADKATRELIDTLNAGHRETQELLMSQNEALEEEVESLHHQPTEVDRLQEDVNGLKVQYGHN